MSEQMPVADLKTCSDICIYWYDERLNQHCSVSVAAELTGCSKVER
jgi:hypothetical protein